MDQRTKYLLSAPFAVSMAMMFSTSVFAQEEASEPDFSQTVQEEQNEVLDTALYVQEADNTETNDVISITQTTDESGTADAPIAAAIANQTDVKLALAGNVTESFTVEADQNVTLDLAGHTLFGQVTVAKSGIFNLLDSVGSGKISAVGNAAVFLNGGTYNQESGTISSTTQYTPLWANGTGSTVNINGGSVSSQNYGALIYNNSTLNVNGGEIVSEKNSGVYALSSTVNVAGGSITSSSKEAVYADSASTITMTSGSLEGYSYGVALFNKSTYTQSGGTLTARNAAAVANNGTGGAGGTAIVISGGKVESLADYGVAIYNPNTDTVKISGTALVTANRAGIVARAGSVDISGGTIIGGTGTEWDYQYGTRIDLPQGALILDTSAGYPGLEGSLPVTISGGSFTGDIYWLKGDNDKAAVSFVLNGSKIDGLILTGNDAAALLEHVQAADGTVIKLDDAHLQYLVPVKVDTKPATYTEAGVLAHYEAAGNKYFILEDGSLGQQAVDEDLAIAKKTLKSVAAVDAAYLEDGNIAYWMDDADPDHVLYFLDADGKTPAEKESLILPKLAKTMDAQGNVTLDKEAVKNILASAAPKTEVDLTAGEDAKAPSPASVTLDKETAAALAAQENSVTLETNGIRTTISPQVLLANQKENSLTLNVKLLDEAEWDDDLVKAVQLSDKKVAAVLSAQLLSNAGAIHHLGGSMTIRIPGILREGEDASQYKVIYVKEDGSLETYDVQADEDGNLVVELTHFSQFFVTKEEKAVIQEEKRLSEAQKPETAEKTEKSEKPENTNADKAKSDVPTAVGSYGVILGWISLAACALTALLDFRRKSDD